MYIELYKEKYSVLMFSSQMTHCSCKQTITAKVESYPDKYSQHMDSGLLRAHSNFHDK